MPQPENIFLGMARLVAGLKDEENNHLKYSVLGHYDHDSSTFLDSFHVCAPLETLICLQWPGLSLHSSLSLRLIA